MNDDIEVKLKEIDKLREEIREREERLQVLLYPKTVARTLLPEGSSLNSEILKILQAATEPVDTKSIYNAITEKYPGHTIDKKRVLSALAYLKNKKKEIDSKGYGKYVFKEKPTDSMHSNSVE